MNIAKNLSDEQIFSRHSPMMETRRNTVAIAKFTHVVIAADQFPRQVKH
jgi:hypothetical protein